MQQFDDLLATKKSKKKKFTWPWTFERVQQDVAIISNLDASIGNEGYNPNWTTRIKSMVAILRDERYKAQRARMNEIISSGKRRDESE